MIERRRLLRRVASAAAVIGLIVPFVGAQAHSAPPSPGSVIIQGAGLSAAGVLAANVDPDVDFWPIYSESTIDNQASHGLSGAIWPGFLVDAFFFLYGVQPQFRGALGISESQWPNPPNSSQASSSEFMRQNFATGCASVFGPEACAQFFGTLGEPPAFVGASETRSSELDSSGSARAISFDYPGMLEAEVVRSRTSSRYLDGRTVVESVFTAKDVTIGTDLHIDLIEARSLARAAGTAAGSDGSSTLRIVGARLGDTPVEIDDQGLHAAGDEQTDDLNEALADEGLELRASQGRQSEDANGEFVDTASGGLLLHVLRERAEEDLPVPLVEAKNQACLAAEENPLNQEITRIRVDQPNPFYGQVPIPGMPPRAQLEQSVPPPMSCPFFNRNFDLTLVLGFTNASARLSPLGDLDLGGGAFFENPTPIGSISPIGPVFAAPPALLPPPGDTAQASVSRPVESGEDLVRRIKLLYGLIALVAAVGLAGRFALRVISAP